MADGILGLGSSGSVDLSSELITKLKTAESKSVLDPITTNKEDTQAELDALTEIQTMVSELLDLVDKCLILDINDRQSSLAQLQKVLLTPPASGIPKHPEKNEPTTTNDDPGLLGGLKNLFRRK